jgi:hypothetical protein
MSDPTLDPIDHGIASWDAIVTDNFAKVAANWVRSTKSADHGQATYFDHAEVESGVLSGASVTLTGLIPAGCILFGITARNTAAVTGAASTKIGDGTTADLFASAMANALGTTSGLANHKSTWAPKPYLAAGDVVFTANTSNFTGGKIRATAHYLKLTPPTS